MRSSADDIQNWLAGLSDRALRRLCSRLTYLLKIIDAEMQRRDSDGRQYDAPGITPTKKKSPPK